MKQKIICAFAALSLAAAIPAYAVSENELLLGTVDFVLGRESGNASDLNSDGTIDCFDVACARKLLAASEYNQVYVSDSQGLIDALANARAGDEIILAGGTYQNDEWIGKWAAFYSEAEGTSDRKIILRSEDPENPALLCGVSQENKMGLYITGDYWIIKDIKVAEVQKGIVLDNSNYSVISGCEVYDTGSEGIHLRDNSSYCRVEDCYIHDNGTVTPSYGEAIYVGSSKSTTDYGYDCHYNTISGCHLGPNTAAEHVDIKEYTIGTVVEDCYFDGTGISGSNSADSFVDIKGNDVIIRNNIGYRNENDIVVDAFQLHVLVDGWGQNAQIYGNTVYLDDESCYVANGWNCSAEVYDNIRYPEGNMYKGNLFTVIE